MILLIIIPNQAILNYPRIWEVIVVGLNIQVVVSGLLSLGSILPKEGDLITMRVLLKLREEVFLSLQEIERCEV